MFGIAFMSMLVFHLSETCILQQNMDTQTSFNPEIDNVGNRSCRSMKQENLKFFCVLV